MEESKKFLFLEDSFAIWEKPADKYQSKIIIPKNFDLNKQQKQKLLDLQRETENKLEEILNLKSKRSNGISSSESFSDTSIYSSGNSDRVKIIDKPEIIHSNLSTNPSSKCITPENQSPEGDVKNTLFANESISYGNINDNFNQKINNGNNNLFENFENNPFEACKKNSFSSKPEEANNLNQETNSNKSSTTKLNSFQLNPNKMFYSQKFNSSSNVNNHLENHGNNLKNYYESLNPNSIYQNINFSQVPHYNNNNSMYNNCSYNLRDIQSFQQNKTQKSTNDPFNVLRENNYLIRINGKNIPFEEPHNRINLENVNKIFFNLIKTLDFTWKRQTNNLDD